MGTIKKTLDENFVTFKFPKKSLTTSQIKYLNFIEEYYADRGRLPTYREIAHFFNVTHSTVHTALNRRGMYYSSRKGVVIN